MIADRVKGKGFRYNPHRDSYGTGGGDAAKYAGYRSVLKPAEQVRRIRAKYGFGVYSQAAYPNDPAVVLLVPDPNQNPDKAVRAALDQARRKAYGIALMGLPDGVRDGGESEMAKQLKAFNRRRGERVDCLKDAGCRVTTAKPGMVEQSTYNSATEKFADPKSVSASAAKTGLTNEITAALEDLDFRTEYATIARPRFGTIQAARLG